jgi:hypothetical protein
MTPLAVVKQPWVAHSESISDYNVVNNMIVNTKLNIAQKVGSATALGYDAATPALTI